MASPTHYVLDVADADAVEAFAERVCTEHGVPDVVVNNAGIGQAGSFLDTPAEQWDRVLDVNLGGVVNGCRAFAKRLVERGTGGHVVNVVVDGRLRAAAGDERVLHVARPRCTCSPTACAPNSTPPASG